MDFEQLLKALVKKRTVPRADEKSDRREHIELQKSTEDCDIKRNARSKINDPRLGEKVSTKTSLRGLLRNAQTEPASSQQETLKKMVDRTSIFWQNFPFVMKQFREKTSNNEWFCI